MSLLCGNAVEVRVISSLKVSTKYLIYHIVIVSETTGGDRYGRQEETRPGRDGA